MIASLLALMETTPYQQITHRDIVVHGQQPKTILLNKEHLLSTYIKSHYSMLYSIIYDADANALKDVLMIFFGFWEQHIKLVAQLNRHGLMDMFRIECKSFFFTTLNILDTKFNQPIESKLQIAAAFVSGAVTDMLIETLNQEQTVSSRELATFAYNMFEGRFFIENNRV